MDCADCAQSIEKSLGQMRGVSSAEVNFASSLAHVSYDPGAVSHADMVRRIEALGYNAEETRPSSGALEFSIEGMDCADCARTVEKAVAAVRGVSSASVNFNTARLSVAPASGAGDLQRAIERVVGQAGYRAVPASLRGTGQAPFWKRERRVVTTAIGAAFALVAFTLSLASAPALAVDGLFAIALVVSGAGFARAGLLAARAGRADMNLLMSVAAVGAAALGDWGEAATVVLLFAFGGTLQAYTLERTRRSIRSLMDLSPAMALVRRVDSPGRLPVIREVRLPVEEVAPGETVTVGPGERVPLDGVILEGHSSVDQSPITGESVPVDVSPGSEVYAGTINGPGVFHMRTLKAANDTALAHIIHMVEEAQAERAPSQQFIDRFSAVYTPVVIAGAVLVAAIPPLLFAQPFSDWFYRALVLLVIACPCALVISTPVSIVAAIGAATRNGVLIKGGATLETLGKVRLMAFDKTGTLTMGRPQVVTIEAPGGDSDKDRVLALAAAVEARSEHPLARAIVHEARLRDLRGKMAASNFKALPGRGAQAEIDGQTVYAGNARLFEELGLPLDGVGASLDSLYSAGRTAVIVGTEAGALGVIALADRPRKEAREALRVLRHAGIREIALLTGDNERTAATLAREVGVDISFAGLLPAGKVDAVKRMAARGPVAMVGDGVNDAPALAVSDVGIAMGVTGTDAALEVAQVALMSDDLSCLEYAVLLSRQTLRVIKQNLGVSFGVKAVALALAAAGSLPLWGAILADMGVSLLVTLNGMRLLSYSSARKEREETPDTSTSARFEETT